MSETEWLQLEESLWQRGWVTDPPVISVNKEMVLPCAIQMKQAIGRYVFQVKGDDDWEQRIKDTTTILGMMKGCGYNLVYKVMDIPVGIICLTKFTESVYVNYLASHPGTKSAGGILMEAAADYSQKCGFHGKLTLFSYSEASTLAYQAMGFTKDDGNYTCSGDMTLDPPSSKLWVFQTRWRIVKYAQVNHYTTRKKPTPPPPPPPNRGF